MPRFTFDRERPGKTHSLGPSINPNAYVIKKSMRGDRAGPIKTKITASRQRRNAPITLAGKYGVDTDEP